MSVRKLTANLLTALVMMSGLATVQAQEYVPVADPFQFDPDFRWFEPMSQLDFEDMKPKKRAHYGWFGTYDRLNLYGSRPELDDSNVSETMLDSGWGHRYEVGYMLPEVDKGWTFTSTQMGIGKFYTVARERVNRINTDDLEGSPANPGPPFGFGVPEGDNNTPGLNTRTVFIQDSENVIDYDAYELNKTWRMEPYRYGGILEPLVGVRWMRVNDLNAFQTYNSSLDIDLVPFVIFGDAEQLVTDQTFTENEILAGQAGFRYTKFRDRFTFTGDFRLFTGASLQTAKSFEATEITIYDGAGTGSEVDNVINRQTTPIYTRNEEFAIGFDVRGEIAYQLTRAISLRCGFQVIDIATGVWRGGPQDRTRNQLIGGDTDQDLVMVGGTFGITLNK